MITGQSDSGAILRRSKTAQWQAGHCRRPVAGNDGRRCLLHPASATTSGPGRAGAARAGLGSGHPPGDMPRRVRLDGLARRTPRPRRRCEDAEKERQGISFAPACLGSSETGRSKSALPRPSPLGTGWVPDTFFVSSPGRGVRVYAHGASRGGGVGNAPSVFSPAPSPRRGRKNRRTRVCDRAVRRDDGGGSYAPCGG